MLRRQVQAGANVKQGQTVKDKSVEVVDEKEWEKPERCGERRWGLLGKLSKKKING